MGHRSAPLPVIRRVGPAGSAGHIFTALGIRNFRLYWCGQLVSQTGNWMQTLALAWLVLSLTNSPLALGTVTMLQYLPTLFLALFSGVMADRVPKRSLLLVTQSTMACQALALALLTWAGVERLWEIYALALVWGLVYALDTPLRRAFAVELVGREQLPNAMALYETQVQSSRIVGPAIGGIGVAALGFAGCFFLNAASFLATIGGLALMHPEEFFHVPPPSRAPLLTSVREGLAYAFRTREVLLAIILLGALGTFGFNYNVFLPLLARYALASGPTALGTITSSLGAGALLAALWVARSHSVSRRQQFGSAAAFSALLLAVAAAHRLAVMAVLLLALGTAGMVFQVTSTTRLQLIAPDELRGRIVSMYSLLLFGTTPIGSLFVGATAQRWGVTAAMVLAGLLCAGGLAVAVALARRYGLGVWGPEGSDSGPQDL